jgi:hypothetical protein
MKIRDVKLIKTYIIQIEKSDNLFRLTLE